MGQRRPNEFAIGLGYSRLLSNYWSGAVAIRYSSSDLTFADIDKIRQILLRKLSICTMSGLNIRKEKKELNIP
jgi:hypothetical protein